MYVYLYIYSFICYILYYTYYVLYIYLDVYAFLKQSHPVLQRINQLSPISHPSDFSVLYN